MENTLLSLQAAEKAAAELSKLDFHCQPIPLFHVREATPKDVKWIEEQKYTMSRIVIFLTL